MNTNIETKAPETQNPHEAAANARASELTKNLFELGTVWARYGLGVGKSALETSARSLEATAKILGGLAETLAVAAEPAKHADAKPEAEAPKAPEAKS